MYKELMLAFFIPAIVYLVGFGVKAMVDSSLSIHEEIVMEIGD